MKNLILLTTLLLSTLAFGAGTSRDKALMESPQVNLLKNPGYEAQRTYWSASGGTFSTSTGSPLVGKRSMNFDASAASQNLDSTLRSIPAGMIGRICLAEILYVSDTLVSGDLKLQVIDQTPGVIAELDLAPTNSSVARKAQINFTCPASGSVKLRITSTANAASIKLDDMFLGSGRNDVSLNQAELVASAFYEGTVGCNWPVDSVASYADFTAAASCPSITVQHSTQTVNTTDNNLPDLVFDNLIKGRYEIRVVFNAIHDLNGTASYAFQLTDGTTSIAQCAQKQSDFQQVGRIVCAGSIEYSSSGPRTFKMQGQEYLTVAGSTRIMADATGRSMSWTVTKYPSQSAEAITLETSGEILDIRIAAPGVSQIGAFPVAATEAEYTQVDLTLYKAPHDNVDSKITCAGTNASVGSTCPSSNESVGVDFNVSKAGQWRICADFDSINLGAASVIDRLEFFIHRVTPSSTTVVERGRLIDRSDGSSAIETSQLSFATAGSCGIYNLTAGRNAIKFFHVNFNTSSVVYLAGEGTDYGSSSFQITGYPITQQFPTPIFTDLQDSLNDKASSGVVNSKVRGVKLDCDSSSSIIYDHGGLIQSIANVSAGTCAITLNNVYTQPPNCTANHVSPAGPNIMGVNVTGNTAITIGCDSDAGVDCAAFNFEMNCWGI